MRLSCRVGGEKGERDSLAAEARVLGKNSSGIRFVHSGFVGTVGEVGIGFEVAFFCRCACVVLRGFGVFLFGWLILFAGNDWQSGCCFCDRKILLAVR